MYEVKMSRLQDANRPLSSECRDVKTCRVCLTSDCKLYHTSLYENLDRAYETLTGLSMNNEEHLPPYLCGECARRLLNCVHFRNRCLRTRMVLVEIAKEHANITLKVIAAVNRKNLKSNLKVIHNEPNHYDLDIEYVKKEHIQTDTQADNQNWSEIKIENDIFRYDRLSEDAASNDRISVDVLEKVKPKVNEENSEEMLGDGDMGDGNVTEIKNLWHDNIVVGDTTCDERLLSLKDQGIKPSRVRMKKKIIENNLSVENNKRNIKRKAPAEQNLKANEINTEDNSNVMKIGKRVKKTKKSDENVKAKDDEDSENCEEETDDGADEFQLREKQQKRSRGDKLDPSMFTVTELTLEEQAREVEARQHLPQYTDAQYKCAVCYRGYSIQRFYESHLVKHNEVSGNNVCVVCRVRMLTVKALRDHMKASHTRQYDCNLCEFVSRHKSAALKHQNFHAGIVHRCPHCPMFSNNYTTYQNHVRTKHGSQIVCALCGYTFVTDKGLHLHKKIKHRMEDAQIIDGPHCETCDVKFVSKLAYDRHLKLSSKHCSDDDPQRISNDPQRIYGKVRRFRSRAQPAARRVAITKRSAAELVSAGPVDCEQCGEKMQNQLAYAQHFRYVHPDKNRTQFSRGKTCCMCEVCGHVTHCNAVLMEHMWLQHGVGDWRPRSPQPERPQKTERPTYQCPTCAKRFTVKNNLKRHLFTHTGQRPFQCDECPKSFKSRTDRRMHVEHVHHKKPWPKRIRSRKPGASNTSVLCEEGKGLAESDEGDLESDKRRGLRKIDGVSMLSDEEQCFKDVNEGDEKHGNRVTAEETNVFSEGKQELADNEETCVKNVSGDPRGVWYELLIKD